MITKYYINLHTKEDKSKIWRIYKSGDLPDLMHEWCYANHVVIKSVAQTIQILDCFYFTTNGIPNPPLEKHLTYDTIIFEIKD